MRKPSSSNGSRSLRWFALLACVPPFTDGTAQIVQGANLGSAVVTPAGDVDDDGVADYVVELATRWEVRSGTTRLALPGHTVIRGGTGRFYGGLLGDLDADGRDDLYLLDPTNGSVGFLGGTSGSPLFSFFDPNLRSVSTAADHDGDGCDDVMVLLEDNVASLRTVLVLSGRNGTTLATWPLPFSATQSAGVAWVGDVDGDGFVDLLRTSTSFAQPFFTITAGPDHLRTLAAGSGPSARAFDTDGDGRDELWLQGDLVDVPTSQIVWASVHQLTLLLAQPPLDLDGDGAVDLPTPTSILSGRTQLAFPGAALPGQVQSLGDIDGDGRDEAVHLGTVFELAGAAAASRVRDRGRSGATSSQTRPRIRHRLRPRLGGQFLVDLQGAGGPTLAFLAIGTAADVDLTPFGAPNQRAYLQPFDSVAHPTDLHGHARRTIIVPTTPTLLGLGVTLQWAVVDPPANALGLATSNALDLVIGT